MVFWRKDDIDAEDDFSDVEYIISDGEDDKDYGKKKSLYLNEEKVYLSNLPRDIVRYADSDEDIVLLKEIEWLLSMNTRVPYRMDSALLITFGTNRALYDQLFDIPSVRALIQNSDYYGIHLDNLAQKIFFVAYNGREYEVQYLKEFMKHNAMKISKKDYGDLTEQYDFLGFTSKEFSDIYKGYLKWW